VRVETWPEGVTGEWWRRLLDLTRDPEWLVVRFPSGAGGESMAWTDLDAWTRSRAVTVADVVGRLSGAALDVAACCDLVYLRPGARFEPAPADKAPSAGFVWALGRAGRPALASGLLDPRPIEAHAAVRLGLATAVVPSNAELPLPGGSVAARIAARDLMRSSAAGAPADALELATFRWLFAVGDPEEGARAFLDKREPRFGNELNGGDN
jgi:enoyl-CoA hydratase/carnithine racemase